MNGELFFEVTMNFQHPDAPKQKFREEIKKMKKCSRSKHGSAFSHPSVPADGDGINHSQGRKFLSLGLIINNSHVLFGLAWLLL